MIRGESGCGKSSLLYRIGLISDDKRFDYYDDGRKVRNCELFRKTKRSFVLQDNTLFDHYDVLGNMKLYASFNNQHYTKKHYRKKLALVNLNVRLTSR